MAAAAFDNEQVIADFRANGGHVKGAFEGVPLLLLHHTGARSGTERVTPLVYTRDGDRYVIIASKAGAHEHPAWYHNLRAHPETRIEVGDEHVTVVAEEVEGEQRRRLYDAQAAAMPPFAEYERMTAREIPVFLLTQVE